jgi:hypothetical protein
MNQVGKDNPEYMGVLTEVIFCLFRELHHPKLNMDAKQITDWLHHVSQVEVEEVLRKLETEDRYPSSATTRRPGT